MRPIALAGVLGLSGCLFDPVIPVEASLACAADADCPAEALCVVGRCMPVEALRAPPPGVLDVTITPTLAGRGGTVEVSFAVDAALQEAPVVDVDVGRPARLDGNGLRDGRYGFVYVVDGTEAPGDAALTATLLDQLGRTSTLPLGTFALDLTAPTFTDAVVARERIGRGLDIDVEATLDAPATVTAGLRFDDGTDIPLAVTVTGLRVRATAVADDRLPDGERAVIVLRGIDAAGNDSGEVVVGAVVIDLDAPSLSAQPLPPTVRPRDLVRFIVSSDEVVVAPTLTVAGIGEPQALVPDVGAGATVGWSWVVPDPGADTNVTVTAGAFLDAAGNAAALEPWTLRIDRTPPVLVVDEALPAQVRAGEVIAARFSFLEPVVIIGAELVRFDDVVVAEVEGDGAGPFTITAPAEAADSEGRYDAIVTAVDAAGNESRIDLGSVVVDARPPALLDAAFTPPEARLGSTVTLQLTFNEAVRVDGGGALPGLVANTPLTFVGQSGTTFTYALVVTPTTPSPVEVTSLAMSDLAGNDAAAPTPIASLVVDNRAPRLTGVAPVASRVQRRTGNSVVVTGRVVDDGGALDEVTATLADRAVACSVAGDGELRCEIPLQDDDEDGVRAVNVNAVDVAGNTSSVAVLVTLDGEGPRVLSTTFGQATARPGATVQLSLLADENLREVELALSSGPTTVRPASSTVGLSLTAPAAGALTLTAARLVDELGNVRTVTFQPVLRVDVDGVGPTIVGSALSTNARVPRGARVGDTIVVEADIEQPLLEAPSFRFGATPMTIVSDDGAGHFVATHVVTATDTEGAIVVGVTAADPLGNIAFARIEPPILVDLTAPELIPGTARLAIQAPAAAPIAAPTAIGVGAQATFSWVVSEPTVGTPVFGLRDDGSVVPLVQSGAGTSFSARFASAAFTDGRHTLLVTHEDEVGNVGTLELGSFDVDFVPPAPLSPEELAALVHVRAPHGSVDDAAPFHRIEGRATLPSRSGQTISVALDDDDLIRLATGALGGDIVLPLDRDFDQVFLQVYDEAGNVAPGGGRRPRTEFIVGLNGRVIGQNASNPHRLELRRQYTDVADDPSADEINGLLVARRDDVLLTADAEGRWQDSGPRPPPSGRKDVASTTHRDTVVMFGGCTEDGPSNEAWAFDGRSWQPLVGDDGVAPPPRCGAALASDGEQIFLFGGEALTGLLDDLWAWNGRAWKLLRAVGGPTARRDMAFGTDRNELVLYGGTSAQGIDGEQWRLTPGQETWRQELSGPPVTDAAYAMDRDVLVVVGGLDDRGGIVDEALRIEAARIQTTPLPGPRRGACATAAGGGVVIMGGFDTRGPLDGVLQLHPGPPPGVVIPPLPIPFVDGACGTFLGQPLIFGGVEGASLSDATRLLGVGWEVVGLTDLPSARSHAASSVVGDGMLLFGGDVEGEPSGEVWELRERWAQVGSIPPVRRAGVVCPDTDTCFIIGGEDGRGRRTTALRWRREEPTTADEVVINRLIPRTNPAVAFDAGSGQAVLFGGVTSTGNSLETCVFDPGRPGVDADCQVLAGPTSSLGAVMTATRDGPVLWAAGSLWSFRRDEWRPLEADTTPPARQFPVLAADGGRIWLHGGQLGATLLDDLWSFEGGVWRAHDPADPFGAGAPAARVAHAGFFDPRLERLVIFSGDQRPAAIADTWDFVPGDRERPGLVVDVDLAVARGFVHLAVEVVGPGAVLTDPAPPGIGLPGGPIALPLGGAVDVFRVAILPDQPGARLVVDALDLRLVRP